MKKIFYSLSCLLIIVSATSCSKQCVQCQAKDSAGVVINTSNVICEHDLNRNHFEDRYKTQFKDYSPVCTAK